MTKKSWLENTNKELQSCVKEEQILTLRDTRHDHNTYLVEYSSDGSDLPQPPLWPDRWVRHSGQTRELDLYLPVKLIKKPMKKLT